MAWIQQAKPALRFPANILLVQVYAFSLRHIRNEANGARVYVASEQSVVAYL